MKRVLNERGRRLADVAGASGREPKTKTKTGISGEQGKWVEIQIKGNRNKMKT